MKHWRAGSGKRGSRASSNRAHRPARQVVFLQVEKQQRAAPAEGFVGRPVKPTERWVAEPGRADLGGQLWDDLREHSPEGIAPSSTRTSTGAVRQRVSRGRRPDWTALPLGTANRLASSAVVGVRIGSCALDRVPGHAARPVHEGPAVRTLAALRGVPGPPAFSLVEVNPVASAAPNECAVGDFV